MKKLTALVLCLLLVAGVLGVQAVAAENGDKASERTIPLVEDKSFAEIDGEMVPVSELESKGYELVLTPVKWDGAFIDQAPQELKDAYQELTKAFVAEELDEEGNQEYWHQTGKRIYTLGQVLDRAFFDASLVKISDNTKVESAKLTLTIAVSNPFAIHQVLNQLHNDMAWNAVNFTVDQDNIVCSDGGTGLYAFLVPKGGYGEIGEFDGFVPSAEQPASDEATEPQEKAGEQFVFTTAAWYAEDLNTGNKALAAAYAEMIKTPVDKLTYADGGEKLKATAQEGGFDLEKLAVSDFLDVSFVSGGNVVESEKVIFEIPVAYASDVRLALHQLPDGTWKVVELMVKPGNDADKVEAVTVSDGGTGVYALLVDGAVRDDILAGKYSRVNLFE